MAESANRRALFRQGYENLGRRLKKPDGAPRRSIEAAEQRLRVAAPNCLVDYFEIAGRETRFNCCYNRLLPTDEWFVDGKRLVFMEENQAVVYWAVAAGEERLDDPPVDQGVNGPTITWRRECPRLSLFLNVMLLWHAAFGGALPHASTAMASLAMRKSLRTNWQFVGEVNRMQAFAKPGKAVCHLKWDDGWRVFAGATSNKKMKEIADEFSLSWIA